MKYLNNEDICELNDTEIDNVNGGIFWIAIAGAAALAGAALLAYQVGQKDGQCHV